VREEMIHHPITRKVKVRNPSTGKSKTEVRILRHGLARRYINKQVGRIKRMFAWAVEQELVPVEVHDALLRVTGLRKGKGQAREKPPVRPVPEGLIDAVLPHVPAVVRTMIQVQRLSGCRPQDIVQLRPIDIDMTGAVWEYRPQRYKTEHHDEAGERIVFFGPQAQVLIKPCLPLNVLEHVFSPAQSEEFRNALRREQRQSPMTPSQARRERKASRRRAPRDRYDVARYRRAIRRGCEKAGVSVWTPHQLRHSAGTEIRKRYGLEASQAVLGHRELGVTQIYAEVDREKGRRVMAEIG